MSATLGVSVLGGLDAVCRSVVHALSACEEVCIWVHKRKVAHSCLCGWQDPLVYVHHGMWSMLLLVQLVLAVDLSMTHLQLRPDSAC